jgi:hypothetical protein
VGGTGSQMEEDESFLQTGNVLVTKQSKLVTTIIVEGKQQLISIDCDFLMRVWALDTKKQVTALLLRQQQ